MKIIFSIVLILLLIPMISAASLYPENFGYYGQNQYYYVTFDAEGEAAIFARIELQNTENLSEFSLKILGQDIELINIVQEYYLYEEECSNWEETSSAVSGETEVSTRTCTDYISYPLYPPKYAQVSYTMGESDGMTNVLMQIPQQDQETITLILYYKTSEYVQENLAVYDYSFQTIQNEYDTSYVRVSVDVAENLYLQGLSSFIDYTTEFSSASTDLARVASSISYIDTGYTETASSLDPYESFTVEGKYAKSWWNIYWWKVLVGIAAFCVLLCAAIYALRKVAKKNKKLGLPLLLGLSSGVILWATWLACSYVLNNWYYNPFRETIMLMVILLTILMSIFLLIVPGLYFGITEGVKVGFTCFIATVITLFVLGVISILILLLFFPFSQSGPIIYY